MRSPNQGLGSIPVSKKWGSGSDARVHNMRHNIITEKVKLWLTLYRPLPPPFLLTKAEASYSPPSPQKSTKIAL